jgi:hypothetical protein
VHLGQAPDPTHTSSIVTGVDGDSENNAG